MNRGTGEAFGRLIGVTGGCRSGKSAFAEGIFSAGPVRNVYYLATARPTSEMAERIEKHRKRRGQGWITREEEARIDCFFQHLLEKKQVGGVLLESLGMWALNRLAAGCPADGIVAEGSTLFQRAREVAAEKMCKVVIVTEETGWGIVPVTRIGNLFRDIMGELNQELARAADDMVLVACGLPLLLKGMLPRPQMDKTSAAGD